MPPLSQSLYGPLSLLDPRQDGHAAYRASVLSQLPHGTHQTGLQLRLSEGPGTLSLIGKWTEAGLGLRGAHSRVIDLSPQVAWHGGWPTSHSPWRSGHHQALPHSHLGHPEALCALEEAFWPLHYALPTFWKCHCLHVGRGLLDYDSQLCFTPNSGFPQEVPSGKRSGPAMHLST